MLFKKMIYLATFACVAFNLAAVPAMAVNQRPGFGYDKSRAALRKKKFRAAQRRQFIAKAESSAALPLPATVISADTDAPPVAVVPPAPNFSELREAMVSGGNILFPVKDIQTPAMTLGLAPRGVIVIEYPADDPIYQVHPGDENFVTVSCTTSAAAKSATTETNVAVECRNSPYDAMVLRPGSEFFKEGSDTSTIITVIRNSGLVFTFLVVPVKNAAKNANHVRLSYDTPALTESRKKAGLAFDLMKTKGGDSMFKSATVAAKKESSPAVADPVALQTPESELETKTLSLLQSRVSANQEKLNFTKPVYGLSAAVLPASSRVQDKAIDVVALKNTLQVPVRLVNNQPLLYVETTGGEKQPVESKPLTILNLVTTVESDNILQPGRVYYFALAYETPLLGSRQQLKVSFTQTNATDAPVSVNLSGIAR